MRPAATVTQAATAAITSCARELRTNPVMNPSLPAALRRPRASAPPIGKFRPDIQGMRAVAVTLVFIFHLWPSAIPAGYVGVDVFFVISGYLITSGLLKEVVRDGSVSIRSFYMRRILRLLPVATCVLLVVAACIPLLPRTQWFDTAVDVTGSALYVENWILAFRSTDYFALGASPSPLQHYWSLSVEEQFYIVWPVLIVAAAYVAARFAFSARRAVLAILAALFLVSLALSIFSTSQQPEWSYFATYTRVWELALGGLLAFASFPQLEPRLAAAVTGLGVSGILVSGFVFSTATPYPGIAALLPTAAAGLVIIGGATDNAVGRVLGLWPFRYVGDRSYSIYLWHWPVIVFAGVVVGRQLSPMLGAVVVILVIGLSHLTYAQVENRFRYGAPGSSGRRSLYYALGSAICCVLATLIIISVTQGGRVAVADTDHPGPAALVDGVSVAAGVSAIPPLELIKRDLPEAQLRGCHQNQEDPAPKSCQFGDANSSTQLILVGDSHALQWVSALIRIVEDRGWGLTSYTKSACPFSKVAVVRQGVVYENCATWRKNVIREIRRARPDIVVTSQSRSYPLGSTSPDETEVMAEGLVAVWNRLQRDGIDVVAIRDTPRFKIDPAQCVAEGRDDCSPARENALKVPDPILRAAERTGAHVVDMSDVLCGPVLCEALVGNVYPWRDDNHLTATYSRMTAPYLAARAGW